MFGYHLHYWFTGPLIVLPAMAFFDSIKLAVNMDFWFGLDDKSALILQIFMNIVTMFMLIMQCLKKFDKNPE